MATSHIQAAFGSGSLFALLGGSNPTPVKFGIIQDVTIDFSFDMKELHGQKQFAVKLARGKAKATWKCVAAQLKGKVINDIFFNGTSTARTQDLTALDEAHTVPGSAVSPARTVTVTYASTFLGNVSVNYVSEGRLYLGVVAAGAEDTGFYSVTRAGVYTFADGDKNTAMNFSYLRKATITDEAITIASTPFKNTVDQAATFIGNVSIKYSATNNPLLQVLNSPTVGQYSVELATGKITFAAADEGVAVTVTYDYGLLVSDEAHTTPNPVSQTVTVTYNATFTDDLGLKYATTGLQLTRVAGGAEATGYYSVSEGVYTFAAGDGGAALLMSYAYTERSGQMTTITNNLMGSGIYFEMVFNEIFEGNTVQIHMTKALANKWNFATKNDDFVIPNWEGSFQADDSDVIGYISMTQA